MDIATFVVIDHRVLYIVGQPFLALVLLSDVF
jgi:hypothetical protein